MKKRFTRAVAVLLAVVMLTGCFVVRSSAASDKVSEEYADILASLTADSYSKYLQGWIDDGAKPGTSDIKIDVENFVSTEMSDGKDAYAKEYTVKDGNGKEITFTGIYLPDVGTVTWNFTIPEEMAGLYGIRFEYYPIPAANERTSSIERKLYIGGQVPFDEARSLAFSKVWKYEYDETSFSEKGEKDKKLDSYFNRDSIPDFKQDAAGNDIRGDIGESPILRTYECTDTDGFYNGPFQFYFKGGEQSISLVSSKEALVIRSITLFPVEEAKSFEDYKASFGSAWQKAETDQPVYLRAETPLYVSDKSVYPSSDRSSAINEPLEAFSQKINVIGSTSYNTTGQWASYEFTVPADGVYNIVARFKQSALQGMFATRVIKLASSDGMYGTADGTPTVPYNECYYTRFKYNDKWQVDQLQNETMDFEFYFKAGVTYTLCVEVGLGDMAEVLNALEGALVEINDCYLEIMKLTGADPDEYRDYKFKQVMPGTIKNLATQAKVLKEQTEQLESICGETGSNTATLKTIYRLLERMGSDEDEIAPNLSNLKSYIGTLGTWINGAKAQSITVDYYTIAPADTKLPKAKAGFFRSAWFELSSFVASFFVDYDAMGVTDTEVSKDAIEVWLAYGRDQSQIWKNLITNDFTNKTNIPVELKLVAAGTLLPSVLAKQGPDSYIGLAATDVLNYAIRGAVVGIGSKDGYNGVVGYDMAKTEEVKNADGDVLGTVTKYYNNIGTEANPEWVEITDKEQIAFNAATMEPLSLFGEVYGLPETASVPMMFYRLDILAELEIDVPQTWDDVLSSLPTLHANNMQIGLAYESAINIFLYQFGGNLWKYLDDPDYAGAAIGLDTNEALDSFQFCTRLYTDYSFPTAFDGPNRLRTGEIPLLIADYVTTYNQLTVFATEIRGLWSFTKIPGMLNEHGGIDCDSIVTVTATVMLHGCENVDDTWEYMKWQAGGSVQADYGNEMVALVGPAAKYATANLQGLRQLSWSATEINALLEQFDHLAAIPNYPGSYIIARYTKFAFLAAYNDGEDAVEALQGYISIINQEITRKRQEFGKPTLANGQTPEDARAEQSKHAK